MGFVLCKTHLKKVFGDVLVRNQAFSDNRNMGIKKCKIGIFQKGILHDFFHLLCLSEIDEEKVYADFLERKKVFKNYKNICF